MLLHRMPAFLLMTQFGQLYLNPSLTDDGKVTFHGPFGLGTQNLEDLRGFFLGQLVNAGRARGCFRYECFKCVLNMLMFFYYKRAFMKVQLFTYCICI